MKLKQMRNKKKDLRDFLIMPTDFCQFVEYKRELLKVAREELELGTNEMVEFEKEVDEGYADMIRRISDGKV
jgi:hypothetical protein